MNPFVNGVSPREGCPGTKLTIRGANLGSNPNDILHVFVGQVDVACSMKWESSKKLTIISSHGEGVLKIIVVTKSGGTGTCEVDYIQSISQHVSPQDEVTYWPPNEHRHHQVLMSHSKQTQSKHMQSEMLEDMHNLGMENIPLNIALSDDNIFKIYQGRGSTNLTESDFNPILYLLKYYYETSYSDLCKTLEKFKRTMDNEKMKEPVSIVKANLFSIFQCLECLEALKHKMDDEKTTKRSISGAFVERELHSSLLNCKRMANHLYENVLKSRAYADSARSAYGVMQRYNFLFNLPHSIRENIKKSEYNLVINDYLRARSLFGRSNVKLFQQVYRDVEVVIANFREILKKELITMPIKCEKAKTSIRYLKQLEVDFDPTWLCLTTQKDWLLSVIGKLVTNNIPSTMSNTSTTGGVTSTSSIISTNLQSQISQKDKLTNQTSQSPQNPVTDTMHQLHEIMTERLQELLQLSNYYIEQEHGDINDIELLLSSVICGISSKIHELASILDVTNPNNINLTNASIIGINNNISSGTNSSIITNNSSSSWLVYCVQQLRSAIDIGIPNLNNSINNKTGSVVLPKQAINSLTRALIDIRIRAIRSLFTRAQLEINGLAFKENWNAEINDGQGSSTRLPSQYQTIIRNTLTEVSRVLNTRHQLEIDYDDQINNPYVAHSDDENDDDNDDDCTKSRTTILSFTSNLQTSNPRTKQLDIPGWLEKSMCAYVQCTRGILDKLLLTMAPKLLLKKKESVGSNNDQCTESMCSLNLSQANNNTGSTESTSSGVNVARLLLMMTNNVYRCETEINPSTFRYLVDIIGSNEAESPRSIQIKQRTNDQFKEIRRDLIGYYIKMKVGETSGLKETIVNSVSFYRYQGIASTSTNSSGMLVCIVAGLLARVHAELMVLLHPQQLAGSVLAELVLSGNVIGWIKEEFLLDDGSKAPLSEWGRKRLSIDLMMIEKLINIISNARSNNVFKQQWGEVKSLLNLMLNKLKLNAKERSSLMEEANKELHGMSMLVQGLKN